MEGAVDVCVVGGVGGIGAGEGGGGVGPVAGAICVGGAGAVEVESLVGCWWRWGGVGHFSI